MQKSCTLIWGYVHCKTSPDHLKHEAKERQKGLIQPLTCQQHLLQPLAAEMIRAQSCLCVQAPWASDRIQRVLLWQHSLEPFPQTGWLERATGGKIQLGDISIQMAKKSATEFSCLLASGSSGASASQGLSPGYWCPLPTSGRRIRLVGAARGRKTPGLCQPVSEGLKHNIQTLPRRWKLLPSPQSDRVCDAATHVQRDDVAAVKLCTWDDCECHSEPQRPCRS